MAITTAVPPPPVVIREKRGWGCWGCGCAALAAIVLLIVALIVLGGFVGYRTVFNFTEKTNAPIQQFDGGDQVFANAHQKVDTFAQQFEHGQPGTLQLNADEVNTLIARDPNWSAVRGHLFVMMKGNEATVQASFPVAQFETTIFADRFLNGVATFGLGFDQESHNLLLDLHHLSFSEKDTGVQSSGSAGSTINNYVNTQLKQNQLARDFLARTTKVSIENGELIIQTQ